MSEQPIELTPFEIIRRSRIVYRRNWSYYNQVYADGAKRLLDILHTKGETIRIPAQGMSIETLRLQYYQGIQYLLDNGPDAEKYAALYKKTRGKPYRSDGFFELSIRKTILDAQPTTSQVQPWKEAILEFMEVAAPGSRLPKMVRHFTEDDKAWLRCQLDPFGAEFVWQVTDDELILIRDKV
jgi:hypothetical protein